MLLKITFLHITLLVLCTFSAAQPLRFNINLKERAQVVENFGASGAWFSELVGSAWPQEKKERMAELLFSKGFDDGGNPAGIGLSCWRFNIGGGTAGQADSSGISNPLKRVACFLAPDGTYNWQQQQGYLWFVKKAVSYGVENLIAFSNTPPVQFTKNGLGFKTEKDYGTNLKEDQYRAYATFLSTVAGHFDKEGIHFNYISPVNEPQWDWSAPFGRMNQEGTPWHNKDIYRIAVTLDSAITAQKLKTKILLPEAATLTALYEGNTHASRQLQQLYDVHSSYYIGGLKNIKKVIAGHSYFTEAGDGNLVKVRSQLADSAKKYNVPFWQSEYSMLADGYRDGRKGSVSAIDCALFLAKVIHFDLTVANATAWQFWNAWEPGSALADTRYYLIALKNIKDSSKADFSITKNLWAFGNFSRFIRPGMQRVLVERTDGLSDSATAKDIMLSAFVDDARKQLVVVAINYSEAGKKIDLNIKDLKKAKKLSQYITSVDPADNLSRSPLTSTAAVLCKPRSVNTIVIGY